MAGDWIKMRTDLTEDPAVIEMAAKLGMDEFSVVGRLHCLWSWADSQSRDGHARGVTATWIDRKLQRDGFAEAMVSAGWLSITDGGITFPNFENHNGETAKARALGKNRKQKQRSSGGGHDDGSNMSRSGRDKNVTREEKRREEVKEQDIGAGAPNGGETSKVPRGTRKAASGFDPLTLALPDYIPAESWAAWCQHRREIKHALTPSTAEAQIKKLTRFHTAGHLAADVIQLAIESGWQGLFEPKGAPRAGGMTSAAPRDFSKGVGVNGAF